VRIQFSREGGFAAFPGLSKPITIDTATLAQNVALPLEHLVESAQFFNRPTEINQPPPGAADYRQYTITVDDGSRRHTVRLIEPVTDPHLAALLDAVQDAARSQRTTDAQ
jgi:hypothetical protein